MTSSGRKVISGLIVMTLSASGLLTWHLFGKTLFNKHSGTASLLEKFSGTEKIPGFSGEHPDLLIPLSKNSATSLAVNKEAREVTYYEKSTGKVLAVGFDGKGERIISGNPLANFISTTWSPTLKEVISTFADRAGQRIAHFSYTTKKSTTLPGGTTSATFSPDGSKISYIISAETVSGIYLGALETRKQIFESRSHIADLRWPQSEVLAFTMEGEAGTSALFTMNLAGDLDRVTDFVSHLETLWSRDGKEVLISFYDTEGKVQLVRYALGTKTENLITTGIRAAECTWSIGGKNIVCGVDDTDPFEIGDITSQRIEKISLDSQKREILLPSGSRKLSVKEILLSPLEDYVIMINSFDQRVYSLKLK